MQMHCLPELVVRRALGSARIVDIQYTNTAAKDFNGELVYLRQGPTSGYVGKQYCVTESRKDDFARIPFVSEPGFVIPFDPESGGQTLMSEAPSRPRALVTGGTTGIGLGIATAMVDAGYEVTATGLTDEQVAAVPQRQHLSAVKLDVTSAESVAAVLAPFHELAALINCAGVIFRGGAEYDMANVSKGDRRQSDRDHAHVRRGACQACCGARIYH